MAAEAADLPQITSEAQIAIGDSSGSVTSVTSGQSVQTAYDSANPGDILELQAGAVFGELTLADKGASTDPITIRSSAWQSLPNGRVTDGSNMAIMESASDSTNAVDVSGTAHHVRFQGIHFRPDTGVTPVSLTTVDAGFSVPGDSAHHIEFDKCFFEANSSTGGRRALTMNGYQILVKNCRMENFWQLGPDAQAILMFRGGECIVKNCFLEGAAENVLLGGVGLSGSVADIIPRDCIFRGNHFHKPLLWQQSPNSYTVKNHFEIKYGRRILVEGNYFERFWEDEQSYSIVWQSNNQGVTNTDVVGEHLTLRRNWIRNHKNVINFAPLNTAQTPANHFTVHDNVCEETGTFGGGGIQCLMLGVDHVLMHHNTWTNATTGSFLFFDSDDSLNFEFRDNIIPKNEWGALGGGTSEGNPTLDEWAPSGVYDNNVLVNGSSSLYPSGNFFPATFGDVQFVNWNNGVDGDYHLDTGSPYLNGGTDGKDIGANIDAALDATRNAVSGALDAGARSFRRLRVGRQ